MAHFARFCSITPVTPDLLKYEEAIRKLNTLQSNASVLNQARKKLLAGIRHNTNVESTLKYLSRVGIDVAELENRIIHISGTKGKGSTAMLTESILRHAPYKTGLYTSPHIISVRERISINGAALSFSKFVDYFWQVYNNLYENRDDEHDMPSYFKFLTVMAFKVFISENVDVAIIEVGIGGELDCTNVFKKTPVVGITSIGLDHTSILGDTHEKIAWQKAGIMKPGCKTLTIPDHNESVLEVFRKRAAEKECLLETVPFFNEYSWNSCDLSTSKKLNASLALQLAKSWNIWNNNRQHLNYNKLQITESEEDGIKNCQIPGRFEVVQWKNSNTTYYLDGAHTVESVKAAKEWFEDIAQVDSTKVLIFNITGERSAKALLDILKPCQFSEAIFCSNNVSNKSEDLPADLVDVKLTTDKALSVSKKNLEIWSSLEGTCEGLAVASVSEAIIHTQRSSEKPINVLITGSLHLVGSALFLLRPSS